MKKAKWFLLLLVLLAAGCSSQKVRLDYGKIIPFDNGMILPMVSESGNGKPDWCIQLEFGESQVYLGSPRMLHSCYLSFAYEDPATGVRDMTDVDLDFYDMKDGRYVYTLPYIWFPGRSVVENAFQTVVYYAPEDVSLPQREVTLETGETVTFPDFTGYCFLFNREETAAYFGALAAHLH